ncbi:glycoside hydrolase family 127 protein [Phenylobacterium deserti]|uniref:Glycoside hydrolase family 127 protein n=1 Tax=Phenylobacterium deserti TaxID=1914756 RepID=A0A328ARY7_9CAUL|nr:glycoside hydrolase family 127 protein [Phenylobacterium deserti]RAK57021.1 glycoside hydrolase family 127 protein [Phenylobacterium deserti]
MSLDNWSRRAVLLGGAALSLGAPSAFAAPVALRAEPFPLSAVRLKPSPWADAVAANRRYLLALEPDRLLHNFRAGAGLAPKAPAYGGWEARGIAGHSLGHYLSALSLMHAQTGDAECKTRAAYIVGELAACQAAHGDGYVGGTTVERDGKIVDGKVIYEEIRRGDVRGTPFDLNGGWVPLYTWHKVHQGLLEAHALCGDARALQVAVGLSDYLVGVLSPRSDAEIQEILACEHGGLNEVFAETWRRTGKPAYLQLAQRLHHDAVLNPLEQGRDELKGKHANTQIPKVIGLAALHEITGEPRYGRAARFFWTEVTSKHSYVIGGNSEREHFGAPGELASRLTDRTCEACNTYNMMKLTRRLYAWEPNAAWFDWYERAHLNHILAHQRPSDGMFAYMTPMRAGSARVFSTPDDSFWCCVGSGMESHAKHGESVWWRNRETLFVNLFIPSTLDWAETGARWSLDTDYPASGRITLTAQRAGRTPSELALRLPAWSPNPRLTVNGRSVPVQGRDGYAVVRRTWRDGDTVTLDLQMPLRAETTPDDPNITAFLSGPVVLAADLGSAETPLDQPSPALVAAGALAALQPVAGQPHVFRAADARPGPLTFRPFFSQWDRRTAVYLPRFTEARWRAEAAAFTAEQAKARAIEARTVDVMHPGEMQPERDHEFRANHADVTTNGGRSARQAWWGQGNWMEWTMAARPDQPMELQVLYWGEERDKNFDILVDGRKLATERRADGAPEPAFVVRTYPIPREWTQGRDRLRVRFETRGSDATVYECRTLVAEAGPKPTRT